MNIIAVDDERRSLKMLERALAGAAEGAQVRGFTSASDALAHARENRVDAAFLDILMGEMSGLELAKRLKDIHGGTNIVFVTGYSQYAAEAFALRASGYVMKPVNPEHIRQELANLRRPVPVEEQARVRIQCFGGFAVFLRGRPLLFSRAKPKELLAYLVHKRGAAVTNAEIAAVLWEDCVNTASVQSNTRNVIAQLQGKLREVGIGDILCRARNSTAIKIETVSCDYYDFLRGDPRAVNAYAGEYMSDYSWAEFTAAHLDGRIGRPR